MCFLSHSIIMLVDRNHTSETTVDQSTIILEGIVLIHDCPFSRNRLSLIFVVIERAQNANLSR